MPECGLSGRIQVRFEFAEHMSPAGKGHHLVAFGQEVSRTQHEFALK